MSSSRFRVEFSTGLSQHEDTKKDMPDARMAYDLAVERTENRNPKWFRVWGLGSSIEACD